MKPSAILLNNPNFKVEVDHMGDLLTLKGVCWDFKQTSGDVFQYNVMGSMPAITHFGNKIIQEGSLSVEAFHLSLAKVDSESERFKRIDPKYAGAFINRKFDFEYSAGMVSKLWATIVLHGPASGVMEALLNNYPGTRLAMRLESKSLLEEDPLAPGQYIGEHQRVISEIFAVDMVVELPKEVVKKAEIKTAKPLVRFAENEMQTMLTALSAEIPDVLWRVQQGVAHRDVFHPFVKSDAPDYSALSADKAQIAMAAWTSGTILNEIYSGLVNKAPGFVVPMELQPKTDFKLIATYIGATGCFLELSDDQHKPTLYVITSYSEAVAMYHELASYAEGSEVYEFCQKARVIIVPLSCAEEGSAIAFITTPSLPYALYAHEVLPDGINSTYVGHSTMGWLFKAKTD